MLAEPACPDRRRNSLRKILVTALFLLEAQAVASAVWLRIDAGREALTLVLLLLAAAAVLAGIVTAIARLLARRTARAPAGFVPPLVACLSPLVLLDLIFIQFIVFLRDIRASLAWVSGLGALYLLGIFLSRMIPRGSVDESRPNRRRRIRTLFAVSFLAYTLLASGLILPPQPFTGDEPHYLLIAQSILSDGDIDVYDDYRGADYRAFYPGPLANHAYPGKNGPEHEYSRHLPGISVLVLPSFLAGELAGKALAPGPGRAALRERILIFVSRLTMCLLAAALGAVFFLLAFRITGRAGPSFLAWALFSFTSPLLYYSQLVYPELPVALIALLIFNFVVFEEKPRTSALWLAGAGIAALPWFGIKYMVISAVLFAFCAVSLRRYAGRRRTGILSLALLPAVSGLAYLGFFWSLYGTLSPAAAYGEAIPAGYFAFVTRFGPIALEVFRFAFGYLFDQRFGIIPHSAAYILLFAGVIMLLKRLRRVAVPVLVLFLAYWMQGAVVRTWGGYCPPGRLLLPVIWIPALFVAEALAADMSRIRRGIRGVAIGLGLAAAFAGISNPRLLYSDDIYTVLSGPGTFSNLLSAFANSFVDPRIWVPSFANWDALAAPATAVWFLAAAGAAVVFAKNGKLGAEPYRPFGPSVHAVIILGLSLAILGFAFFNVRLDGPVPVDGGRAELLFQDGNTHGIEPNGFWTKGTLGVTVLVSSPGPLSNISLTLSSPVSGRTTVRAGMSQRVVIRSGRDLPPATVDFDAPIGFRLGGRYLYSLQFRDDSSFVPYKLDRRVGDNRTLGIHVSVSTQ